MRQLFVPACVCLMTWTGSTGPESKLSLENFAGVSVVNKKRAAPVPSDADTVASDPETVATLVDTALPPPEAAAVVEKLSSEKAPVDKTPADAAPIAVASIETSAAPADAPIEIPMQSDVEQTLLPRALPMPPVPKPVVHRSSQEICDALAQAARSNGLPAPFFIRLLFQESGFKPAVVSSAGAQGIAQFMPETSASMGLDNPFDPVQAIPASARLLRNLFQQFGNLGLAAAAYNAGPKRIQDWLAKHGKLPQETQGYVKIITGRPAETWKVAAAGTPAVKLPRQAPCQEQAGLLAWNGPDRIPVPPRSPLTHTSPGRLHVAMHGAMPATSSGAKSKRHGTRVTMIIQPAPAAKTEAKTAAAHPAKGAVQLAASKHKHRQVAHKQVAQR